MNRRTLVAEPGGEPRRVGPAELDAEVIVFGSGSRTRFAPPAWLQPLMAKRVGVEAMDTQAACRTYNILVGEGRNVAVALLLETGQL